MPTSTPIHLKLTDTLPVVRRVLRNADGTAIDLSSALEVRLQVRPAPRSSSLTFDVEVTIVPGTGGEVDWTPEADSFPAPGSYCGEFQVEFPDDKQVTVPNDGYIEIVVTGTL